MGWYLYVTRGANGPVPDTAASQPSEAHVNGTLPAPETPELPLSHLPDMAVRPASRVRTEASVQAVSKFYRALSAADGKAAAAIVVPAKRGSGPFNEANISKFYGSFKEPLVVRSIREIDENRGEAKNSYRVTRTACEGVAIVETETDLQRTLIRSIRANC